MNSQRTRLTFSQSAFIFVWLVIWVVLFIVTLSIVQQHSGIYPSLWVFLSSILLLIWLSQRLSSQWAQSLNLNSTSLQWILFGLILGLIYWAIDHWMMNHIFQLYRQTEINSWQQGTSDFYPASLILSTIVMAPIFEELVFRGLLLNALKQKTTGLIAVLISSLIFASIHWSWPEFISLLLIGMIYAYITLKSQSIFPALMAHITHNALTFWLYAAA